MDHARARLLALSVLAACGSSAASTEPLTPGEAPPTAVAPAVVPTAVPADREVDGLYVPAAYSGDPRACTADADCTCNTEPDLARPCCQDPRTMSCYRRDYWEAVGAHRRAACAGVDCGPPLPPTEPMACSVTARCQAGRCSDACAAVPPTPPS